MTSTGFTLKSAGAIIAGVAPVGAVQRIASADRWQDLSGLFGAPDDTKRPVIIGEAPVKDGDAMLLSLQRVDSGAAATAFDLQTYQDVTTQKAARALRTPLRAPQRPCRPPMRRTNCPGALRRRKPISTG